MTAGRDLPPVAAPGAPAASPVLDSVLVTGGGSGIGAATAVHLARQGVRVTITGRRADALERVCALAGPLCIAVAGDVTHSADRQRMLEAAVAHGGGLQGLVLCAANMLRGDITDLDESEVLALFNVNVVAAMMLAGAAVPHLALAGGAVVTVGSVHTRRAFPGASPYAATKGAIEVLTRVLAAELGPRRIRVNCVIPGAVPTELNLRAGLFTEDEAARRYQALAQAHALQRVGTAEEVAEAIDHLLRATWTTGACLAVDGGLGLGVTHL